jgi:pimeloyl-ACP methyl ester carboxylesterase
MIPDFPQIRVPLATGVELDAVDIGPRDGEVLMFLHGFPESHRTWRHQLVALSAHYRCIAPDQRGYRGSSKPQEASAYTPDKLTADIFALADALGVDHFTIVGHDWGGAIAWSVALNGQPGAPNPAYAGRVTRAIIANAPHPYIYGRLMVTDPEQRAAAQYIRMFRDTNEDAFIREHGLPALMARAFAGRVPSGGINPPEELERLRADWEDRDAVFGMLNWYRASPMMVPASEDDPVMPEWLEKPFPPLAIPTLIIWAMADPALPPSNLDGIETLVPSVTIERVPDVGHFIPWEAHEIVTASMARWLAGNRAT